MEPVARVPAPGEAGTATQAADLAERVVDGLSR